MVTPAGPQGEATGEPGMGCPPPLPHSRPACRIFWWQQYSRRPERLVARIKAWHLQSGFFVAAVSPLTHPREVQRELLGCRRRDQCLVDLWSAQARFPHVVLGLTEDKTPVWMEQSSLFARTSSATTATRLPLQIQPLHRYQPWCRTTPPRGHPPPSLTTRMRPSLPVPSPARPTRWQLRLHTPTTTTTTVPSTHSTPSMPACTDPPPLEPRCRTPTNPRPSPCPRPG